MLLSDNNDENLEELKSHSVNILLRIFFKNQCEVPFPMGYLAHIIEIITAELNSPNKSSISSIMKSTKSIFSLNYRGLLGLIPVYLKKIKEVLKNKDYPTKVKNYAVSILASLLCFPDHYSNYIVTSFDEANTKVTMEVIKDNIQELILYTLRYKEQSSKISYINMINKEISEDCNDDKFMIKVTYKAICCATVMIYQEAIKKKPNIDFMKVSLFH